MPIQPISFQLQSFDQANPLLAGLAAGQKLGQQHQMFPEDLRQKQLANAIAQVQAKYADPMAQADLSYRQAQTPNLTAQTGKLYKDIRWADPKALADIGLQKAHAGLLNEQSKWFGDKTQAGIEKSLADAAMKNAQKQYAPAMAIKGLSSVGKSYLEPGIVSALLANQQGQDQQGQPGMQQGGQAPQPNQNQPMMQGGQAPVSPDMQNAYDLYRQKQMSDSSARQKNLYATNIEKTLANINPDHLTQYSGANGTLSKKLEEARAPFGKQSKDFDNYQNSLNASQLLATQVRQFYGDSIQPDMIKRLEALTNPSSWNTNPKLAKEIFSQTKNILGQELGTYRDAMKSSAPYQSQDGNQGQQQQQQQQQQPESKSINGANYVKINGQWYHQ